MSLISRLVGSKTRDVAPEVQAVKCSHPELAPRWDSAADMGKRDRIVAYACTNCQATLTPDEAAHLVA
jgi:hypothetical protein